MGGKLCVTQPCLLLVCQFASAVPLMCMRRMCFWVFSGSGNEVTWWLDIGNDWRGLPVGTGARVCV